jgi:hypothetical protein
MENLEKIIAIIVFITVIIVLYSFITAVWSFNPTEIEYFNMRLFGTAFISLFVLRDIIYVIEEE